MILIMILIMITITSWYNGTISEPNVAKDPSA